MRKVKRKNNSAIVKILMWSLCHVLTFFGEMDEPHFDYTIDFVLSMVVCLTLKKYNTGLSAGILVQKDAFEDLPSVIHSWYKD